MGRSLLDIVADTTEITMFGDSALYMSQEYIAVLDRSRQLYRQLVARCGADIEGLLDEYTEAVTEREDFVAEHYFEQGFLAGRGK